MREFEDHEGRRWVASVKEIPGLDFKGSYFFFVRPVDGGDEDGLELRDVRWNSRKTADRTLRTMSGVELRRRLRQALGRLGQPQGSGRGS